MLLPEACEAASVPECTFSHTNQSTVFPQPHGGAAPLPQTSFWGSPWARFSIVTIHGAPVKSRCGVSVETSSPQWDQRPATVPKKCHKSNLTATFSDPCASLWGAVAKKSALCENIMFTMVDPHSACPGASLFTLRMESGKQCAPEAFFLSLLCQLLAPK